MALDTTARTWHDVVTERERVGDGVERCPCLYRFINFEDQVLSGLAAAAHVNKGLSGSQARNGAFRSEGHKRLVAGQHVPDRLGQLASELDLGDFRAALAAEAALGALVALLVERMRGGVDRCFHQPPAQVSGAVLGQRAAAVDLTGLAHARAQAGVPGQLDRR
jgi:hypothetical protein